ncbi:MAG: M17 family metallopeptidase [Candidatus Melainabacteria bacterium]
MPSAETSFKTATTTPLNMSADALIVPVFEQPAPKSSGAGKKTGKAPKASLSWTPTLKALDKALQGMIATVATDENYTGAKGKLLVFRKGPADQLAARRVVVIGLGDAGKVTPADVEKQLLSALRATTALDKLSHVAVALPAGNLPQCPQATLLINTVDAVLQCTYRSAEAKKKGPAIKTITLLSDKPLTAGEKTALAQGEVMAKARSLSKDLTNKPPNLKSTQTMVATAKDIAGKGPVALTVQNSVSWIEKNMPCFFTVARGSLATDPPKFLKLTYTPKGPVRKKIALVGKSVMFDTGGYQVKTGNFMNTMKGDMTGGALVLGVMKALRELAPPNVAVTAYLAATPNKIDSDAMVPDSIVNTTCGKKVEIRHTDAEGRLTLIDAVAKAAEDKPEEIITVATLTGSASMAVGMSIALMGNNPDLEGRVLAAAETLGEPIQPLRVTDEDYDNIKSKLDGADIINTSHSRSRGAQSAAAFVMSGAPNGMPMAHLDIAGADMTSDEKATGIGQKTLIQFILNESEKLAKAPVKKSAGPAVSKSAKKTSKKRG